jgi:hypothetical protein
LMLIGIPVKYFLQTGSIARQFFIQLNVYLIN